VIQRVFIVPQSLRPLRVWLLQRQEYKSWNSFHLSLAKISLASSLHKES